MSISPHIFDIVRLPESFGTGRLQDLLLTFDNLNSYISVQSVMNTFPIKCNNFITVHIMKGWVRLVVNLHEVEIHEGQTLVMMPRCIFEGRSVSEDLKFFGVLIEEEYMDSMRKGLGLHIDLSKRYYNFSIQDNTEAVQKNQKVMYDMINRELTGDDYNYKKEVIQRYCEIWVLKNLSLSEGATSERELTKTLNRREQIFRDFLTLLERNYTQERSISFYANQMCLTPKYLSTIVKEVSGKNGMQWIDDYVALEAKALLREGGMSVKQVSDQLHFPSQSMFGRFFKKMTGYSPKKYKLL